MSHAHAVFYDVERNPQIFRSITAVEVFPSTAVLHAVLMTGRLCITLLAHPRLFYSRVSKVPSVVIQSWLLSTLHRTVTVAKHLPLVRFFMSLFSLEPAL